MLFSLGNGILLILLSHGSSITLSLSIKSKNILAGSSLLIKSLLGNIKLMFKISVFSKKKLSLSGLIVAEGLDVIELSSKGRLGLGKHVQVVLKISNNTEELSIFIGNLVLGGSKVSKGKVGSINLLVDGVKVVNQVLVGLVSRSLASDNLISGSSGIRDFSHDGLLVFVNLGLHLLEGINLLLHLKNSISLLPLQVAKDRLRGNVGLLNILAELDNFSLTLLVKLNLGNSGTTGLIVSLAELLNLTSHVRSLTLSLGTSLALSLKLLFSSLNTGLELLDVLLGLGNKGLLIVKLRREHMDVLLLVGNS